MISRISTAYLFCWIFTSCYTGRISSSAAVHVTLDSITIFQTHEWFKKPTVYFRCNGENHTVLPDVKEANVTYKFKGQESWQPLTNFTSEKCKRCGLYEQDLIPPDDIFEEWELCPSDFPDSDGKYLHVKDKEFNAIFLCEECVVSHKTNTTANNSTEATHKKEKGMHERVIIAISVVACTVFIIGFVVVYKYLMNKRRAQEQARFMKLFEDNDDLEEELEMSHII